MIKGITVILLEKTAVGVDKYNKPVYSYARIPIDNVLVAPASADEQKEALEMYNRKAVYTLGIPKGDTHTWEGQKVEFWGKTYEVVGIPLSGIDDLIPLEWNTKVKVALYE